jgi:sec-independent protein translocase protein TatC
VLQSQTVLESAMISMSVSFYAALFLTIPILVYQLWMFVGVGLLPKERRLAFLFIPAGIIFFYIGTAVGYFIGLPYYFAWLIEWAAHDPTTTFALRQSFYHDTFTLMTVCFGLIADIPWLIMVLVRVGFVTVETMAKQRKVAIMINTVIAALITPPDGVSMLIMMVPLFALFELGLLLSRVMMWHHRRATAREEAIERDRLAAEELAAHQAHEAYRAAHPEPTPRSSPTRRNPRRCRAAAPASPTS